METIYLLIPDGQQEPYKPEKYFAKNLDSLKEVAVKIMKDDSGIEVIPKYVNISPDETVLTVKFHALPVQIIKFHIIVKKE